MTHCEINAVEEAWRGIAEDDQKQQDAYAHVSDVIIIRDGRSITSRQDQLQVTGIVRIGYFHFRSYHWESRLEVHDNFWHDITISLPLPHLLYLISSKNGKKAVTQKERRIFRICKDC